LILSGKLYFASFASRTLGYYYGWSSAYILALPMESIAFVGYGWYILQQRIPIKEEMTDDNSDLNSHKPHTGNKKFQALLIVMMLSLILVLFGIKIKTDQANTIKRQAINRHDPAAVLQAYFDAWERNDWITEESLMATKYQGLDTVYTPVKSLKVIEIQNTYSEPNLKVYSVTYEIQIKGELVSITSGRQWMTVEISWDASRDEWVISNYGHG
jgi:hypothetical protein